MDARPRRSARGRRGVRAAVLLVLALLAARCGSHSQPDPFTPPLQAEGGAAGEGATGGEGGTAEDPELGGPCVDDLQCNDDFECTTDHCDLALARCRHVPSDAVCDDGVYCNGVETCSPT